MALSQNPRHANFATTQWSVVFAAGNQPTNQAREALEDLCRAYWHPIYAYARRRVNDVHEAQDITQAFFAHLLEKGYLAAAAPERGRFRAFILTAFKHFLSHERERANALKRGGGVATLSLDFQTYESRYPLEPATTATAEQLFDREWALTLLNRVLDRLRDEMLQSDKGAQFEALKNTIIGDDSTSYRELAERLSTTEAALKMTVHRVRRRYRELLRDEISHTVLAPESVDDELRSLFATFSQ